LESKKLIPHLFIPFKTDISGIKLPQKFTFPFYYTPHLLSEIASQELQKYIQTQKEWRHNFGLDNTGSKGAVGKMFGVLICKTRNGELGQLWAFSGKLAESNQWSYFVPTVFDMLTEEGFYKKGEEILNSYNNKIKEINENERYLELKSIKDGLKIEANTITLEQKKRIKTLKVGRDQKRIEAKQHLSTTGFKEFNFQLSEESKKENIILKKLNKYFKNKLEEVNVEIKIYEDQVIVLKQTRRLKSAQLQQQLFKEYSFLNNNNEVKSLGAFFDNNPPAGAGECCAPKLLQYAFKNKLKPIALAEFWWGKSPNSEIRTHKQFYPSCNSKCKPILQGHMLQGLEIERNPLEIDTYKGKYMEVLFEDEWLMIIHKPHDFLSVPGKVVRDSVYERIKKIRPNATGPLMVHRLDRATSGLMIIAKDEQAYVNLQKQFTERTVKKRYIALLDGIVKQPKGKIDLPLRVDLEDRPRQLVCHEHGKKAITEYEVIKINKNKSLIYFYPITGRTHQLRVHSAHNLGLGIPIVGDDLYGNMKERLCLHAEWIEFSHPVLNKRVNFSSKIDFI